MWDEITNSKNYRPSKIKTFDAYNINKILIPELELTGNSYLYYQ